MNYNQACDRATRIAIEHGYTAVGINYNGNVKGPGRYTLYAKNPDGIKVLLAYSSSYIGMVEEVIEYLV